MSETILGGSRFDDLYNKAYYAKNSLDRADCYFDKEMAIEDYKNFLTEKLKNPTRANAAMQKVISKKNVNYPALLVSNIYNLKKEPEIKTLVKLVSNKVNKAYPNTKGLRNLLNSENRIQLDYVTPKWNTFSKFILKLKSML